jgi:hypothetical protein
MRLTVLRDPLIVDVNGKSCRTFSGVDENGNHVRVTIGPGDKFGTLRVDVDVIEMPKPEVA